MATTSIPQPPTTDMTDDTQETQLPKKRSFFKRAAWQDVAKKEDQDMFSHANKFKDIVAEQNKRREEEERMVELKRQCRQAERREGKRRKVSTESLEKPSLSSSVVGSISRASRSGTDVYVYSPWLL